MSGRFRPTPLTPARLVGLALRPVPLPLLRPGAALAMNTMRRRHEPVFRRLVDLTDALFVIDAEELPFLFLLRPGGSTPTLIPVARDDRRVAAPTAAIRGPLPVLVDLLEGRLDGDAMFFSRDITIEGDMEAVLTLRNAMEDGEIDLVRDLLSLAGPFAELLGPAVESAISLFGRAARDLENLRAGLLGLPANKESS